MDREFVINALLQHNFLPRQNRWLEEVPPVLSSNSFSQSVARTLGRKSSRTPKSFSGYDSVTYRLTRSSGVPRLCSIPHPRAYAHLALSIHKNWDHIDYITEGKNSQIHPFQHFDGRIAVITYPHVARTSQRPHDHSFGKRFMVRADIANFYPSIYSHSVPWAVAGLAEAKKNRRKKTWYNDLDRAIQLNKRGETQGIPIGPATSSIIAEIILARVDDELRRTHSNLSFVRYLDDYKAYCKTEEQAQAFINTLTTELAKYNLLLNVHKTEIVPLPSTRVDPWLTDLITALPIEGSEISSRRAIEYINLAVRLDRQASDGRVLKYALKALFGQDLDASALSDVLPYALNLSFHQPGLLPLLEGPLDASTAHGAFKFDYEIQQLILEHSRFRRSDAVSWALYYCNKYGVEIEDSYADEIILSSDCIPILMLYLLGNANQRAKVISFASGSLDKNDLYELDTYWLLLYQLFLNQEMGNPYTNDDTFDVMATEDVNFVIEPPSVVPLTLGQWLVENVPRGTHLDVPNRHSNREIASFDDQWE